jgi:hypothetical protein
VIRADSVIGEKTIDQPITLPSDTSSVQLIERPLLDTVTPIEDMVLVEDASDDEEAVSQVIVEDPIYLITIEGDLAHSTTDVKAEVSQLTEDPSTKAMSSPSATTRKEKDVECPPIHPSSPPAITARRRR